MVNNEPEKTLVDVVEMLADGSLKIAVSVTAQNGMNGADSWISPPGSPDFIEFGTRHRVTKPGQVSAITKKLINGEWHQSEQRFGE